MTSALVGQPAWRDAALATVRSVTATAATAATAATSGSASATATPTLARMPAASPPPPVRVRSPGGPQATPFGGRRAPNLAW